MKRSHLLLPLLAILFAACSPGIPAEVETTAMQELEIIANGINELDGIHYEWDQLNAARTESVALNESETAALDAAAWCVSLEFVARVNFAGTQEDWGDRVMVARVVQSEAGDFQGQILSPDIEDGTPIEEAAEIQWQYCLDSPPPSEAPAS